MNKKERQYIFTEKQLIGFSCWILVEGMNHPGMSIDRLIKLIFKIHTKELKGDNK